MQYDRSPLTPAGSWQRQLGSQIWIDRSVRVILAAIAAIPICITLAIIGVLVYETVLFFQQVSLRQFLTDSEWTPLFPSAKFGIFAIGSATLMTTAIAMTVATPVGLLAAIYLAEYAPAKLRLLIKPTLEALSGIPTVVYGYFALLVVAPNLQKFIPGLQGFSALTAGLVTGMMILPIVSSLSEDAIRNVPYSLREAGYAMGFTKGEAIVKVVLPVAFPGIIASFTLAASRSLGETMIAAIAGGQHPNLTFNPLIPIETMTAFIIQVSLGRVSFNSLAFRTIFTVGMVLFLITLALNTLGHWLVRRHRKAMTQGVVPSFPQIANNSDFNSKPLSPPSLKRRLPPISAPIKFHTAFQRRYWLDRFFIILAFAATLAGLAVIAVLFFDAFNRGSSQLDWQFVTGFPSRKPENAGIFPALMGTLWLLGLTGILAFPIGVGTAIFLEKYLPDNCLNQILEINIANLSAVPSIIYGLLGLELFVRLLAPVTGGASVLSGSLTLTAIVLPLLIVATRSALRRVPDNLQQAGYAVGMTRTQVLWYVVLPSALPSIITGTLLALARAIGETSPLIAVGALSFISFAPPLSLQGVRSPFIALPVQIFNWVSRPQTAFQENAAAAIIILVALLFIMSVSAVLLQDRYRNRQV